MPLTPAVVRIGATEMPRIEREMVTAKAHTTSRLTKRIRRKDVSMRLTSSADLLEVRVLLLMRVMARESTADTSHATVMTSTICATVWETEIRPDRSSACVTCKFKKFIYMHSLLFCNERSAGAALLLFF